MAVDLNAFYEKKLAEYGPVSLALDWNSPESQRLRYDVMVTIGDLQGKRILDVGCGLGDFYDYLCSHGIVCDYVGCDVVEDFIRFSREKFPKASFYHSCILEDDFWGHYDYIFACGVFNINARQQKRLTARIIRKMFAMSGCGISFNMLSNISGRRSNQCYLYYDMNKIMTLSRHLTNRLIVRQDYLDYEFTCFLYPPFGDT